MIWRPAAPAAPVPAEDTVQSATYAELRRLIGAWPHAEDLARAAHAELLARRHVVDRLGFERCADAADYFGPQVAVLRAPWLDLAAEQARPRVARWQRPTSSTLYASDEDLEREAINRAAREFWSARRGAEE